MALIQVTLTSVGNGRLLDVPNGARDNGVAIVVNPAPGAATGWRVNTAAGVSSFTIVNNTTGKCADAPAAHYQVRQQPCDGRASEKWYFQPVSGSPQKAFMIRHESDNMCLTTQIPPGTDNGVYTNDCDASKYQQWTIPADTYQVAWSAAVDYAAARCAKDHSNCSWSTTSQEKPKLLPSVCVSPVWFNGTTSSIPWTFSLNTSTGWKNTIGFNLQTQLTVGGEVALLKLEVSASV
ncbi:RICIN domain-containing protein, partial [Amycolatopsis sp. NPDC059657]|uniref:RICIN domain-containing protein n=1 Tax=Amycolatopsis sp. NPDC059657 TaxID=3346899 RepID=UPI00366FCF74